jgi:hypothetical protein
LKISGTTIFAFGVQWYVLQYLPVVDCLPFKKGNNVLELRKMPANAIPDTYEMTFIYKKGDQQKEFPVSSLPDSTWTFVDRKQVLVKKGSNNEPVIKDFTLKNKDGVDRTEEIMEQSNTYFLLFVLHADGLNKNDDWLKQVARLAIQHKVYIVTSVPDPVQDFFNADVVLGQLDVLVCDGTAIKTAARAIPTLYKMNGAVVEQKWSSHRMFQALKQ